MANVRAAKQEPAIVQPYTDTKGDATPPGQNSRTVRNGQPRKHPAPVFVHGRRVLPERKK